MYAVNNVSVKRHNTKKCITYLVCFFSFILSKLLMPYYYLISEVPDSRDEPLHYDIRTYKKPETINLLLPSIHASREDNILDTGGDAEEAVRNLHASCKDSGSWPSTEYGDIADVNGWTFKVQTLRPACTRACNPQYDSAAQNYFPSSQSSDDLEQTQNENSPSSGQDPTPLPEDASKAQAPVFAKFRPPFWAYDSIRPELLEAARALFYERRRQQAMYAGVAAWGHPAAPRYPTDYELFAAWASLPRSDKLAYVSEVSGSHPSGVVTSDSLSTQRAVTSLLASCPDSCSWPSFQFSRLQAQQRHPQPHQHPRPYHPYHHCHPQPPLSNPLPFKLD